MKSVLRLKVGSRIERIYASIRIRASSSMSRVPSWSASLAARVRERFSRIRSLPKFAITHVQPPVLLVLMAGTTVAQYEKAGQLGRLDAALGRYSKRFRTVALLTNDREDFTGKLSHERVRHLRSRIPFAGDSTKLALNALLHLRTVRNTSSIVMFDEQSAPSAWLTSSLSGAKITMSIGAPWAPPRSSGFANWKGFLVRVGMNRADQLIEWRSPSAKNKTPRIDNAELHVLPQLTDTDLYCPLTTTDPTRPRTVGVFIDSSDESAARVVAGVTKRLQQRGIDAVIRVLVAGERSESFAASLNAETSNLSSKIEFQAVPSAEMLPDAISRMRMCVAFDGAASTTNLLRAMSSGVPGIAVGVQEIDSLNEPNKADWTSFVLRSGATEEEITKSIETLFREPGLRLRLAREGRRFVVANHSLDSVAALESELLIVSSSHHNRTHRYQSEDFDAETEAEGLALMIEAVQAPEEDNEPVAGSSEQQKAA